jgi:6-pyruvoyltetrahydropterin/6-carboxytetrahydropterin synthase
MMLVLTYEFSSAHLYCQKKWSVQKNKEVFGKCYTDHGHGHNYKLQLEIEIGDPTISTVHADITAAIEPVISKMDHAHLNFDIPYFKDIIPTTENISLYLKNQIQLPAPYQLKLLRLFEMDSIFVELTI